MYLSFTRHGHRHCTYTIMFYLILNTRETREENPTAFLSRCLAPARSFTNSKIPLEHTHFLLASLANNVFHSFYIVIIPIVDPPELMASERHVKREIARMDEEIPRWRTIIDTGAPPGE